MEHTALTLAPESTTESTAPESPQTAALTLQAVAAPQPPVPQTEAPFTLPPQPEPPVEHAPATPVAPVAPDAVAPPPEVPPAGAEPPPTNREQQQYWQRVLTGDPATVPQAVRDRAGANDPGLSPEQQVYTLCSSINRSWMADHSGRSREDILHNWKQLRSNLAQELEVADDEQEVYVGLSLRESDAPRRETARRIYEQAYMSGLQGHDTGVLHPVADSMNDADLWQARVLAAHAYEKGLAQRESWLPMAQTLTKGLDLFAAIEEDTFSAPRVFASMPSLARAVDAMSRMGAEERSIVMYLTRQQAEQAREASGDTPEDEWLLSRAQRAVRRGASSMGFGLWQGIGHMAVGLQKAAGDMLGGELGREQLEYAAERDQRLQVLHDIKNMAQQEVYPLLPEDSTLAERMFIDAAQATPAALVAFCGGAGFGALTLSGMGESVAEARRRAPEGSQQMQLAAGVVGGAVQASIYVGMSRIGKKLLEQSIGNFIRARGGNLGDYSLAGLKATAGITAEGVKLMLAGKAASATELGVHELAAQVSDTASNIDWQQYGDDMLNVEYNMREAAATLPFLLIGAGRASLRHFSSPDSVIGSGRKLLEWNVDKKTVDAIVQETNVDVRSEMLRDAVRQSELWQNPQNHRVDIMRAMSLLNTNGRILFRDMDSVSEFLNWEPRFASATPPVETPAPKKVASRTRQGLQLREDWERNAGLWQGPGSLSELRVANGRSNRVLMNGRGRYAAAYYFLNDHPLNNHTLVPKGPAYAPLSEKERTEALTSHFDELRSLSYRLLWQLYCPDSMASAKGRPMAALQQEAEHTRREFINLVCEGIISKARGESESAVFDKQSEDCGKLLRRYSGRDGEAPQDAAAWLRKLPDEFVDDIATQCLTPDNKRLDPYGELREFYWLMYRARVCTAVLSDLLPMSNDFQTLLAHSCTPAQAYEYMLKRELLSDGAAPERPEPDAAYAAQNAESTEVYTLLTGNHMQQVKDKDGKMLYRMVRPDGDVTPWHSSREAVVNDVAGNAAFTFMPIGAQARRYLLRPFDSRPGLRELPIAGEMDYSGHDQLCSIALHELAQSWLEDASHRQPALLRQQVLRANAALNASYYGDVSMVPLPESAEYRLETNTSLTPFGLALGRFKLYWLRQLESGFLSPDEAAQFLEDAKVLTPAERIRIMDMRVEVKDRIAKERRKSTHGPRYAPVDIPGSNKKLSQALATFTLRYFAAKLNELDVPESVKQWYAYSAFSPAYVRGHKYGDKLKELPFRVNRNSSNLLSFVNHRNVEQLREMAPHVQQYRKRYARQLPKSTVARLMPGALGQDEHRQLEQVWSHYLSGEGVFHRADETLWNMLRFPADTWQALSQEERSAYTSLLHAFCVKNPLPRARVKSELPETATEMATAAIHNLDNVLRSYPELHRYSLLPFGDSRVNMVTIHPYRQLAYQGTTELGDIALSGESHANYDVQMVDMPAFISNSPRVRHALRLLYILRSNAGMQPYTDGQAIYWGGRKYGKFFGWPKGLENWTPHPPLRGVRYMLQMQKYGPRAPHPTDLLLRFRKRKPRTVTIEPYVSAFREEELAADAAPLAAEAPHDEAAPLAEEAPAALPDGVAEAPATEAPGDTAAPLEPVRRRRGIRRRRRPQLPLPSLLEAITVYHSDFASRQSYRLMPGVESSSEPLARRPYVVGVREGMYVGQGADISGELPTDIYMPLETFEREYYLPYLYKRRDVRDLRRRTISHNLQQVLDMLQEPPSDVQGWDTLRADMLELLMRLYEDSGYSEHLIRTAVSRINAPRSHALQLADHMLSFIGESDSSAGLESHEAYQKLSAYAQELRDKRHHFLDIVEALVTGKFGSDATSAALPPEPPPDDGPTPEEIAAEEARKQRITTLLNTMMQERGMKYSGDFTYTADMEPMLVEWLKSLEESGLYKVVNESAEKERIMESIMEQYKDSSLPEKMQRKLARILLRSILRDRKDEENYRRQQARKAQTKTTKKRPPEEDDES